MLHSVPTVAFSKYWRALGGDSHERISSPWSSAAYLENLCGESFRAESGPGDPRRELGTTTRPAPTIAHFARQAKYCGARL